MRLSSFALTLGAASSVLARSFDYRSTSAKLGKRVSPRPDDFWDHVVKGSDLAKGKVGTTDEEAFDIGNFNLRANKVDPSELGIDDVKQYSGYLDNEGQDKHLFYCKETKICPLVGD